MNFSIRLSEILIYFLPISLITGPLLPEIVIFSFLLLSLFLISKKQKLKINTLIFLFIILNIIIFVETIFVYQIYDFENLKYNLFFRFIIFSIFLSYILSINKSIPKNLVQIIIIILFILLIDSLIQFFSGVNILGFRNENHYRVSSFFGDEYILGSYVGRLLPIAISLTYIFFKKKYTDLIILIILGIGFLICIISGDRTSIIFPACLAIIYLMINFNKEKLIIFFIFSIFITGLSYKEVKIRFIDQTISNLTHKNQIIYFSPLHHNYAIVSLNMFNEEKIFGHGFKSFRKLCDKVEHKEGIIKNYTSCSTHPHNYYLQILAENGFLGFISLLSILFFCLFRLIKLIFTKFKKTKTKKQISLIFVYTGIVISLFPLVPTGNFFNGWLLIILFSYVSIVNYLEKYYR